jgi:hypothetical protein
MWVTCCCELAAGSAATPTPLAAQAPADLVAGADSVDANGLLRNPKWRATTDAEPAPDIRDLCGFVPGDGDPGKRAVYVRHPPCTSQPVMPNEPDILKIAGWACNQGSDRSVQGHLHWYPVTMTGTLGIESYEGCEVCDHDYTFSLQTPPGTGITRGNDRTRGIELEFNGEETIQAMFTSRHRRTPGWEWMRADGHRDGPWRQRHFHGTDAVVTGLFGLDAVHGFQAELHPVYAFAVRDDVETRQARSVTQRWIFFVRSGGNEGECSGRGWDPFLSGRPPRDRLSYVLSIPWRQGDTAVSVVWGDAGSAVWATDSNIAGPFIRAERGREIRLRFTLPAPEESELPAMVFGDLVFQWQGPERVTRLSRASRSTPQLASPSPEHEEPGDRLAKTLGQKGTTEGQALVARMDSLRRRGTWAPDSSVRVQPPHDTTITFVTRFPPTSPLDAVLVPVFPRDTADTALSIHVCGKYPRPGATSCLSAVRWGLFGTMAPTGAPRFGAGLVVFDLPTSVFVPVDARLSVGYERVPNRLEPDHGEWLWHFRFNGNASPAGFLRVGELQAYGSVGIDAVKEPNGPWLGGLSWGVGAHRRGTHWFLPTLEWRSFLRPGGHFGSLVFAMTYPMGFP